MKNKKGFTLVELLAVIVILGIIVGIAIPITNSVISNSKQKSLVLMVDEAEKFVGDQWKLNKVDPDSMTDSFKSVVEDLKELEADDFLELNVSEHKELVEEMGLPSDDIKTIWLQVDENDIPCVVIVSLSEESKLFNDNYWTKISDGNEAVAKDSSNSGYYSKCCSAENVQIKYNDMVKDK